MSNDEPDSEIPSNLRIPKGKKPLEWLLTVMDDELMPPNLRVRAAIAAAQYVHVKREKGGAKDAKERAAKTAATGKLAPAEAPKLVVNNK